MSEQSTERPPERWAIVEIMGHRVIAGRLGPQAPPYTVGIVVEVPMPDGSFAEEFYGAAALFGVRVVPEAVARRAAESSYHVLELRKALGQLALPAPAEDVGAYNLNPGESRSTSREAIYAKIDERLSEGDYDPIVLPTEAAEWENRLSDLLDEAEDVRNDGAPKPRTYRRILVGIAANAVAAIESHDRAQGEDEEVEEFDFSKPPEDNGPDDEPHGGPGNDQPL